MSVLLDTSYVVALATNLGRLRAGERAFLDKLTEPATVSAASLWELAIKWRLVHRSGDRKGPVDPHTAMAVIQRSILKRLPISFEHAITPLLVEPEHADPFDRMLLKQAQVEGLKLFTRDRALAAHPLALSLPGDAP